MPSAKVAMGPPVTRSPVRHERANASAPAAWTPITFARLPENVRARQQPQAPLPPPIGTMITSVSGSCSRISRP
jgi:hypothetical protein